MLVITIVDSLDSSQETHKITDLTDEVIKNLDRLIFEDRRSFSNPYVEEGRVYQIRLSEKGSSPKRAVVEEMSATDDQLNLLESLIYKEWGDVG